jgi:hypothetical protein
MTQFLVKREKQLGNYSERTVIGEGIYDEFSPLKSPEYAKIEINSYPFVLAR